MNFRSSISVFTHLIPSLSLFHVLLSHNLYVSYPKKLFPTSTDYFLTKRGDFAGSLVASPSAESDLAWASELLVSS